MAVQLIMSISQTYFKECNMQTKELYLTYLTVPESNKTGGFCLLRFQITLEKLIFKEGLFLDPF